MKSERIFSRHAAGHYLAVAALMCLFIVPFLMNIRVGPQTGFIIESTAAILALLMVVGVSMMGGLCHKPPLISWMFALLALWLVLQARILDVSWYTQVDLTAALLLLVVLATWALASWQQQQQHSLLLWVAWALVFGAMLQTAVMWLQYLGWSSYFKGAISYSSTTNIMGQLGQRNHLGHYLMWGMVGLLYLQYSKAIANWLAAALIVYLGFSMGLVGSRTLLLYLFVISLLAVMWFWRHGKCWQASLWWILLAMAWVLVMQFGFAKLVELMGWSDIRTGVGRLAQSGAQAVDTGRSVEWQKAWWSFLNQPLWGHGWGSFASQSFYLHSRSEAFLGYVPVPVLYTHAHNGVLQLLSETGLLATVWVMGCFGYLLWRCFKYAKRPESFFLAALVCISLCHSLLEYPLWYGYFLLPFALFWALMPSQDIQQIRYRSGAASNMIVGLGAVVMVAVCGYMLFVYSQITAVYGVVKNETPAVAAAKKAKIQHLIQHTYLLRYYAQMALMERSFDAYQEPLAANEVDNARQVALYRPYPSYATRWGLYLERSGQHAASHQWLEQTWRYYPSTLNATIKSMQSSVWFENLNALAQERCEQYQQRIKLTCPQQNKPSIK